MRSRPMSKAPKTKAEIAAYLRQVSPHMIRWAIGGLGWSGAAFIFYGGVASLTQEQWAPLERIAGPLSSALTIVGTAVTAGSIYFYSPNPTPPVRTSYLGAAIVVAACLAALVMMIWWELSAVIVNGFAIAGLAGALYRIQPNPKMIRSSRGTRRRTQPL